MKDKVLAFIACGMNIIYQIEQLPLMLAIWAVIYTLTKRDTEKLNTILKKKRQKKENLS